MSWWAIANPSSSGDIEAQVHKALGALDIDYELHVSTGPAHLQELAVMGRAAGYRRFAAIGGDGTAHHVLNGMLTEEWEDRPVLAILPAGTGSDFIRTFGLPRTLADAARHLTTDDLYQTDVIHLSGDFGDCYYLNAFDAGIAAASIPVAESMPRFIGTTRYPIGFWLTLPRFRAAEIELTVGKRSFHGEAINVVAANGQFFGGGMNVAPKATVMDGLVDVQVFSGPRRNAFTVMPRLIRGLHLNHKAVRRFTGTEFTLRCPEEWPVEADGEVIGAGSVTGRVVPGAIDFKI